MDASQLNVAVVFLAGVMSFFSPCVLPLVPAYLSVISGLTADELLAGAPAPRARLQLLFGALGFLLGFSLVTVALLGGLITLVGALGPLWMAAIRIIGALVLCVFALQAFGLFRSRLLTGEARLHFDPAKLGPFGSILVGVAFAFGWTPCIGPILTGVGALAAGTARTGLLAVYTLGLAVPFLLAALFLGAFLPFLSKATRFLRAVEIISGVLLLLMAGLLLADRLTLINQLIHW